MSTEAEEQVLGAMLFSDNAATKAVDALTVDHFYLESHGKMFAVMRDMVTNGIPTDVTTVGAALAEKGLTEATGGRIRLHELVGLTPASANVAYHIKLVHDAWVKRLVHAAALRIYTNVEMMSADEAVAALEESALTIATVTEQKHDVFIDLKRALSEVEQRFNTPLAEGWGIPTPFSFLAPLQPGRLYVLGGYPKDGKTIIATQFAATAAQVGKKVGVLSLEMSYSDLTNRWLQQRTGISQEAFRTGRVPIDRIDTAREEMQTMSGWDVKIIDDEAITPQAVRKYQRIGKFDLLIIDHLHMMRWKDRHDLEDNIKLIARVSREFGVPVLLLCQLSRAGDHAKPFPVPSSRQMRETAMLEAVASSIWLIYRERDEYHVQTNDAKLIVAMDRYGPANTHSLYFNEVSTSFMEDDWRLGPQPEPVKEGVLVDF